MLADLNFPLIVLASAAYMGVGALWYSPVLFGTLYAKHRPPRQRTPTQRALRWAITGVAALVSALGLALVLANAYPRSAWEGVLMAALTGMGVAALLTPSAFLVGTPRTVWAISAGYRIVGFAVMGALMMIL